MILRDALHVPSFEGSGSRHAAEAVDLAIDTIAKRGLQDPSSSTRWTAHVHVREFDGRLRGLLRAGWGSLRISSSSEAGFAVRVFDAHVSDSNPIVLVKDRNVRIPRTEGDVIDLLSSWKADLSNTASPEESVAYRRSVEVAARAMYAAMEMADMTPTSRHRLLLPTRRLPLEVSPIAHPELGDRVDLSPLDRSIVDAVSARSYAALIGKTTTWTPKGAHDRYRRWEFDIDGRPEKGLVMERHAAGGPIEAARAMRELLAQPTIA